jgi:hypothetical protein
VTFRIVLEYPTGATPVRTPGGAVKRFHSRARAEAWVALWLTSWDRRIARVVPNS